jgi:integrase
VPKGPRGEKRPADVIGAAVKVMRIATGEETEKLDPVKSAAAELGSRGGKARAEKLTQANTQNRRLWVRLREKGGKRHAMPCHHNLEEYLTGYLDDAGLRDDPKGPLFHTIGRGTGKLTRTVLPQANAYAMIRRRAAAAGIATKLGKHSFRATGITAYLKNGGTLEKAAAMANHASTRTTQLYDRRRDEVSLDEVERIVI